MAVAVDAVVSDVTSNSVTSRTLTTLTVGSGPNRALVVAITLQFAASGLTVSWDSTGSPQSLTLIGAQSDAGNVTTTYLYGLVAPTSGNKTLAIAWTGTSDVTLAAISFTGVNQTGSTTSFAHFNSSVATAVPSLTVTSATGNYVVGAVANATGSFNTVDNTSWYLDNAPNNFSAAGNYAAGAATVTLGATPSVAYAYVGVDVVATSGGSTNLTLSNTVSAPGTLVRRTGIPLTNAVSVPGSLVRSIGMPLPKTVSAPASLVRLTGKLLTNVVAAPATASHATIRALSNTVTSVASLVRQSGLPLLNTVSALASLLRSTAIPLTNTVTAPAFMFWLKPLLLTNSVTAPATLAHTAARVISNAVTVPASLVRQTGAIRTAVTAPVATRIIGVGFFVISSTSPVSGLVRGLSRTLARTVTSAASVGFASGFGILAATTAPVAAVRRFVAKFFPLSTAPIANANVIGPPAAALPGFVPANGPVFQDTGQGASDRLASWGAWTADPSPMTSSGASAILRQDNNGGTVPVGQGGAGSWAPILDGSSNGSTSGGDNPLYVNE